MYKPVEAFLAELYRKKTKTSRGRQKVPVPLEKQTIFEGNVAIIKPRKEKR